jgi:hypothetical protein
MYKADLGDGQAIVIDDIPIDREKDLRQYTSPWWLIITMLTSALTIFLYFIFTT